MLKQPFLNLKKWGYNYACLLGVVNVENGNYLTWLLCSTLLSIVLVFCSVIVSFVQNVSLMLRGGSRGAAQGTREPLILGRKRRNDRREKSQKGIKVNPPPPPFSSRSGSATDAVAFWTINHGCLCGTQHCQPKHEILLLVFFCNVVFLPFMMVSYCMHLFLIFLMPNVPMYLFSVFFTCWHLLFYM